MLWGILVVVLVAVAALLAYAASRPDSFRIERATMIQAPAEVVAGFITDFHRWTAWSPWEHIDPQLKRSYGGAPSGVGTTYAWEGNNKVGSGRMEILESSASTIRIQLDFLKPFKAHNEARFDLRAAGGATTVTWAMTGPSPFLSKLMGVVFNLDRMVGGQFEQGLAKLKAAAEKP